MVISCPKCKTKLSVPPERAGQVVGCPKCQTKLRLPGQPAQAIPTVTPMSVPQQPVANDPFGGLDDPLANAPLASQPLQKTRAGVKKKKKRKGGKSGSPLIWILIGVGVLAFLLVSIFGYLYLTRFSRPAISRSYIAERSQKLIYQPAANSRHTYDVVFSIPETDSHWDFVVTYRTGNETVNPTINYEVIRMGFEMNGNIDPFDDSHAAPKEATGQFQVSPAGQIRGYQPGLPLPYGIGTVELSPVVNLNQQGTNTWKLGGEANMRMANPNRVTERSPASIQVDMKIDAKFEVTSRDGNLATIKETRTVVPGHGAMMNSKDVGLTVNTNHVLDTQANVLKSSQTTGTFLLRTQGITKEVHFKIDITKR